MPRGCKIHLENMGSSGVFLLESNHTGMNRKIFIKIWGRIQHSCVQLYRVRWYQKIHSPVLPPTGEWKNRTKTTMAQICKGLERGPTTVVGIWSLDGFIHSEFIKTSLWWCYIYTDFGKIMQDKVDLPSQSTGNTLKSVKPPTIEES